MIIKRFIQNQFSLLALLLLVGCSGNSTTGSETDLALFDGYVDSNIITGHDGIVAHDKSIAVIVQERITDSLDLVGQFDKDVFWIAQLGKTHRVALKGTTAQVGQILETTFLINVNDNIYDTDNFLRFYKMRVSQDEKCDVNIEGYIEFSRKIGPLLNLAIVKKFANHIVLPIDAITDNSAQWRRDQTVPMPTVYSFREPLEVIERMDEIVTGYPNRNHVVFAAPFPFTRCVDLEKYDSAVVGLGVFSPIGNIVPPTHHKLQIDGAMDPAEFLESSIVLEGGGVRDVFQRYQLFYTAFDTKFIAHFMEANGLYSVDGLFKMGDISSPDPVYASRLKTAVNLEFVN